MNNNRDFHLTLAVLLHYFAKSENPIYSFQKQSLPLLVIFFILPSLWSPNSPDLNPVNYAM